VIAGHQFFNLDGCPASHGVFGLKRKIKLEIKGWSGWYWGRGLDALSPEVEPRNTWCMHLPTWRFSFRELSACSVVSGERPPGKITNGARSKVYYHQDFPCN
jgi:hypothetical protein